MVAWMVRPNPIAPAQRRGWRFAARNKANVALLAAQRWCDGFEMRKTNPEPAKMAACGGGWRPAVVTKPSQWASPGACKSAERTRAVGRGIRKPRERTHGVSAAAPGPRERSHGHRDGKDCTDRRNYVIVGPQRGGARSGETKPRFWGEEGIAAIGGVLPTAGGHFRVVSAGRLSVHRAGGIGAVPS